MYAAWHRMVSVRAGRLLGLSAHVTAKMAILQPRLGASVISWPTGIRNDGAELYTACLGSPPREPDHSECGGEHNPRRNPRHCLLWSNVFSSRDARRRTEEDNDEDYDEDYEASRLPIHGPSARTGGLSKQYWGQARGDDGQDGHPATRPRVSRMPVQAGTGHPRARDGLGGTRRLPWRACRRPADVPR